MIGTGANSSEIGRSWKYASQKFGKCEDFSRNRNEVLKLEWHHVCKVPTTKVNGLVAIF